LSQLRRLVIESWRAGLPERRPSATDDGHNHGDALVAAGIHPFKKLA
jgi:hypothetical protein